MLLGIIGGLKINFRMNSYLKLMIIYHRICYNSILYEISTLYEMGIWYYDMNSKATWSDRGTYAVDSS